MPLNSGILQQIAQGGQSLAPEMMRKGAQLGQQLKMAQQADQDRSALQAIAQAFGTGGSEQAIRTAGELGQLGPALQIQQRQAAQQAAEARANQARSSIGKLREDLSSGRISQDDFREGVRALQSRVGGFMAVSPGATVFDRGTGQPVFSAPQKPATFSATDKKAILEADEQVQTNQSLIDTLSGILQPDPLTGKSLNEVAGSGATAGTQSFLARNDPTGFFDDTKGEATTELNNRILTQALGSMRSIFGGNPTEGERKVLVDLQASVDKTPNERKAIIERGVKLAQRRLEFNRQRAQELRSGTFFSGSSSGQQSQSRGQTQPDQTPFDANMKTVLDEAKEAIAAGADPQMVMQRMQEAGFDPSELGQ